MGGGSKAPPPPDYTGAAKATAEGNLEMARSATEANRPTQISPLGSVSWYNEPGTDQWVQDVQLDPTLEGSLRSQLDVQKYMSDLGTKYMGRVDQAYEDPFKLPSEMEEYQPGDMPEFDPSELGAMPELGFGAVQGIQDAMMSRLTPDLQQRRALEEQKNAAMGITRGSDAWGDTQKVLGRTENDASQQALLGAMGAYDTITGRQLQGRGQRYGELSDQWTKQMQGRQQGAADYAMRQQGRQQQIQEQAYLRSIPLNELNAILRGQNVNMPQFSSFAQQGQTGGPNLLGAADQQYQAALGQANASRAGGSALGSGIGAIAGGVLGSVVPVVGTAAGAALGSGLGGYVGGQF